MTGSRKFEGWKKLEGGMEEAQRGCIRKVLLADKFVDSGNGGDNGGNVLLVVL